MSATSEEHNALRLYAAEIIRQLWEAGEVKQLKLLKMQCDQSLADLSAKKEGRR